jgi:transposase
VKEELVYLGVDIAKAYLDAAIGNEKSRFSNDALGHRQLINWIKQMPASVQVICEPSGGYERALVRALVGAQLKVSLVPANRVRQFARAKGILAKTDRIDAKLLCAFAEAMQPGTISASQLEQQHLRELESQRRHLTHLLVMEQNRAARMSDLCVCKLNRRLISQIKKQIEQLDLLVQAQIKASPELCTKAEKLTAISGVGTRTAALLLAQMTLNLFYRTRLSTIHWIRPPLLVGLHFSDPPRRLGWQWECILHCYIGALERIDELSATIAAASRRVVESSVAVVANDSGVASLQRL